MTSPDTDLDLDLARRQLIFNLLPSMELHDTRADVYMPRTIWSRLAATAEAHRNLSRHILATEKLAGRWVSSFDTFSNRLALLSQRTLDRLVFVLGIALNAEWLSSRIRRAEVKAVRDALSAGDYAFAAGKARFIGAPANWPEPQTGHDIKTWVTMSGERCLAGVIDHEPYEVSRRYWLRRPLDAESSHQGFPVDDVQTAKVSVLCRKIAREVSPECTSLLA